MKNKKILLIIVLFIVLIFIGVFTVLFTFNKNTKNVVNTELNVEVSNETIDNNVNDDFNIEAPDKNIIPSEQQKLIDEGIYAKAFEEFEKYYAIDYVFDLSQVDELKITLEELKNDKGYDTTFLDGYNCDLDQSSFIISKKDEDIIRSLYLECK